jgi:hypothetical protein
LHFLDVFYFQWVVPDILVVEAGFGMDILVVGVKRRLGALGKGVGLHDFKEGR